MAATHSQVARSRHERKAHRYDKLVDALRASLWFRPGVWMLVYAGLALGLVALDTWLDTRIDPAAIPRLFRSDPNDARALLGAIVGAMLTVVSLAFSIVMLAVVQTSNVYSPRLLRLYMGDAYNQHVLGVLLGTFVYSLIVLRSVHQAGFAPTLATNVGVLLALFATIALIAFLHHVPQSIKVDSIIQMILANCEEELDRAFPSGIGIACETIPTEAELSAKPLCVPAVRSGHVQLFDFTPLEERDDRPPIILRMTWGMADFLVEGTPLAEVWGEFDDDDREALERACVWGTERTLRQDPRFGLEQLTDVALRALSPGVNDPTTACSAIHALTVLFAKLITREPIPVWRSDASERVRVKFQQPSFEQLVGLSYLRILAYGSRDVVVLTQLIRAAEQLARVLEDGPRRWVLIELLEAVHASANEHIEVGAHRTSLDAALDHACAVLGQRPFARLTARAGTTGR